MTDTPRTLITELLDQLILGKKTLKQQTGTSLWTFTIAHQSKIKELKAINNETTSPVNLPKWFWGHSSSITCLFIPHFDLAEILHRLLKSKANFFSKKRNLADMFACYVLIWSAPDMDEDKCDWSKAHLRKHEFGFPAKNQYAKR